VDPIAVIGNRGKDVVTTATRSGEISGMYGSEGCRWLGTATTRGDDTGVDEEGSPAD
jgi:hypothetical protein